MIMNYFFVTLIKYDNDYNSYIIIKVKFLIKSCILEGFLKYANN